MTSRYQNVSRPGHPLASPTGSLARHRAVLFDKIGYGPHICHWCPAVIHWGSTLLTDHVDEDKQNNSPENLVPACRSCNQWRNREREGHQSYTCTGCGIEFQRYKSQRRSNNVYCTSECYLAARHGRPQSLRKA